MCCDSRSVVPLPEGISRSNFPPNCSHAALSYVNFSVKTTWPSFCHFVTIDSRYKQPIDVQLRLTVLVKHCIAMVG